MVEDKRGPVAGPLGAAFEDFLERTRALAESLVSAGSGALGAAPLPGAVTGLVGSLRQVVEQVPPPTAQLDMFLQEIRAKRALVHALREQLAAFDAQLDTLERSLAPLQAWGRQWSRVRSAVLGEARSEESDDGL